MLNLSNQPNKVGCYYFISISRKQTNSNSRSEQKWFIPKLKLQLVKCDGIRSAAATFVGQATLIFKLRLHLHTCKLSWRQHAGIEYESSSKEEAAAAAESVHIDSHVKMSHFTLSGTKPANFLFAERTCSLFIKNLSSVQPVLPLQCIWEGALPPTPPQPNVYFNLKDHNIRLMHCYFYCY